MIWTWLKDGKPYLNSFFKTKKSLLTSYDMMPLRGLYRCEKELNEKGKIVHGEFIQVKKSFRKKPRCYIPFKNGQPDMDAVSWSCADNTHKKCFNNLVYYASTFLRGNRREILINYYCRSSSSDGRLRRPLEKLYSQVDQILSDLGYSIRAVRFRQIR